MDIVKSARKGLTLIELVVVLVIVAATAGLMLPLIPNIIQRTEAAVGTANISEIAKAIQLYETTNFSYPERFDSLATSNGLFDGLPVNSVDGTVVGRGGTSDLVANALTAEQAIALAAAGITEVANLVDAAAAPGGWSVTADPYDETPTFTTIDVSGVEAAFVNSSDTSVGNAFERLNLNEDSEYVVFGLGRLCTIVGQNMAEAPVHFLGGQVSRNLPAEDRAPAYGRYGVIFEVSNAVTTIERARFVGVVALEPDGLTTSGDYAQTTANLAN